MDPLAAWAALGSTLACLVGLVGVLMVTTQGRIR